MRVEELVGQRIREHRERLGITQEELGRRLEPLLGKPWPRQAVWAAEQGKRSFAVAELVALADVLQTRPARLITPPLSVDDIELPSGSVVQARDTRDLPLADPFLEEVRALARDVSAAVAATNASSHTAMKSAAMLSARVEDQLQRLIEDLVNDPDEITFTDDQPPDGADDG